MKYIFILLIVASCCPKLHFKKVKVENIEHTNDFDFGHYYSCVALHDTIVKYANKIELNAQNDTLIVAPVYLYFFSNDTSYMVGDTILVRLKNDDIKIMQKVKK